MEVPAKGSAEVALDWVPDEKDLSVQLKVAVPGIPRPLGVALIGALPPPPPPPAHPKAKKKKAPRPADKENHPPQPPKLGSFLPLVVSELFRTAR